MSKLHLAPNKRFRETILLVPFFGAEKSHLQRHIDYFNDLGYNCLTFVLKDSWQDLPKNLISSRFQFGLRHVWTDQIEKALNETKGQKILFSFSNPSASAIEAIARRSAQDIAGLICDSGPSGQIFNSMIGYFTHQQPLKIYPLKAAAAALTSFLWDPRFSIVLHQDLAQFPKGFRVLSIRGWKDKLITPTMIDRVFQPHEQIEWQKLSLPDAGHLNGLKDFPDEYKPIVSQFLREVSTPSVDLPNRTK